MLDTVFLNHDAGQKRGLFDVSFSNVFNELQNTVSDFYMLLLNLYTAWTSGIRKTKQKDRIQRFVIT